MSAEEEDKVDYSFLYDDIDDVGGMDEEEGGDLDDDGIEEDDDPYVMPTVCISPIL